MELDRCYKVLGLRTDADIMQVRVAYRKLALQYHPDRNSGPEATKTFAAINEAYNTIMSSNPMAGDFPNDGEDGPDEEAGKVAFSILSDKERVYHVSPTQFESELRKRFNPSLASGIYCNVGGRWFEIDAERHSGWSPFRWSSGRGGVIDWGRGMDKERWKSITWDDFWSYARRHAVQGVPQKNMPPQAPRADGRKPV